MNSFLFNVGLILLCSIRLASLFLKIFFFPYFLLFMLLICDII